MESKPNLGKCCEDVHNVGRSVSFHRCVSNAVVIRDKKPYCKIHDPVEVKRRRDQRHAAFEAEQAANAARHARHSDLLAKGEKYDALKLRSACLENHVRELCAAMRQLGKEHHREVVAAEITLNTP